MATYAALILQKREGIAKITLNRPEVLNALNRVLRQELVAAFNEVQADDNVRVVILTGAGRAFCAGNDLKEFIEKPDILISEEVAVGPIQAMDNLSKPIIAAVNGHCYNALEIILACDIVLAADNAVFADTHARIGQVPGWGGSQRLPRTVGSLRAMEMMLTCEPIDAKEAERIGLVNRVVAADKLAETAEELARKIVNNSPSSVKMIKALVKKGLMADLAPGLAMEALVLRLWKGALGESITRMKAVIEKK